MYVSHIMVAEIEPWSPGRVACALNLRTISPDPLLITNFEPISFQLYIAICCPKSGDKYAVTYNELVDN